MRSHVICCLILIAAVPLLAGQVPAKNGDPSDEELAARIRALNDQIEILRAKQNVFVVEQKQREEKKLAEQRRLDEERRQKEEEKRKIEEEKQRQALLEQQQRAEAEKKRQFARVEIRGKLVKVPHGFAHPCPNPAVPPAYTYQISINQLNWILDFGADKELFVQAEKLAEQAVIVTGAIDNTKGATFQTLPYPSCPFPGPVITPYQNELPTTLPQQYPPNVQPGLPPYPPTYTYTAEPRVVVNVASLKLAQ